MYLRSFVLELHQKPKSSFQTDIANLASQQLVASNINNGIAVYY